MDLAAKASCVVFKSAREPTLCVDALLLSTDRKLTHASLKKILAIQRLA
jgi:hypothetical protein